MAAGATTAGDSTASTIAGSPTPPPAVGVVSDVLLLAACTIFGFLGGGMSSAAALAATGIGAEAPPGVLLSGRDSVRSSCTAMQLAGSPTEELCGVATRSSNCGVGD